MAKVRKASANWYIAATHYLTSGFVIPLLASIVVGFVSGVIFGPGPITRALAFLVGPIAIWFGVMYSARFLEKTYIMPLPQKVIRLASIYYVILNTLFIGANFVRPEEIFPRDYTLIGLSALQAVISAVVFYVASQKFVKATSASQA